MTFKGTRLLITIIHEWIAKTFAFIKYIKLHKHEYCTL